MAVKLRRIPISGWRRCLHQAASFESEGEFCAAKLLDAADGVDWWLRNDPHVFRIPTPAGYFEPDFLYRRTIAGVTRVGILEVKGEVFWGEPGSPPRIKSSTARAWVRSIETSTHSQKWSFALVLDQDATEAKSFDDLLSVACDREN